MMALPQKKACDVVRYFSTELVVDNLNATRSIEPRVCIEAEINNVTWKFILVEILKWMCAS